MEGLGDQLLAGAAFALEEDGGAAGSDLRDEVEEAKHGFAFADDVLEVVALLEGALELDDLFFGAVASDGGADVGEEFFVVPGLLDEVFRACADGVDDVADRAVGGDHDDGKIGLHLDDAGKQVDAAFAGEREIEQEEIVFVAREQLHAGGPVSGYADEKPSRVRRVSSDSRMAASSSMMRMRGSPTTRAVRCRWRVSAASSVVSDMNRLSVGVQHSGGSRVGGAQRGDCLWAGNSSWKAVPTPSSLST